MPLGPILGKICEHKRSHGSWSWNALAQLVFGAGTPANTKLIAQELHDPGNAPYLQNDHTSRKTSFHWDVIAAQGLLPKPKCPEFRHLCTLVQNAGLGGQPLTYSTLARLRFGTDDSDQAKMDLARRKIAVLVTRHQCYLSMVVAAQPKFLWDRIGMASPPPIDGDGDALVSTLAEALGHEYIAAKKQASKSRERVTNLRHISDKRLSSWCYEGTLDEKECDEPDSSILEGGPVYVEWTRGQAVAATLLAFDPLSRKVVLEFSSSQLQSDCEIYGDATRILQAYRSFVQHYPRLTLAKRLVEGSGPLRSGSSEELKTSPRNVQGKPKQLNSGQEDVVRAGMSEQNQILFVDGPPGTGKTETLACLVVELALSGERLLVTAISNRAIDELSERICDVLGSISMGQHLLKQGRVIRIGYAGDKLLGRDEIFPQRARIKELRDQIQKAKKEHAQATSLVDKAKWQTEINTLSAVIAEVLRLFINAAQIVLTTTAQVALLREFKPTVGISDGDIRFTERFSSLVCDEASMMNLAHVLPLCYWGDNRLVIAGDERQLGPVVIAQSRAAQDWLHKSLFGREIDRARSSRRILSLREQRRMHPSICAVVSKFFYPPPGLTTSGDYVEHQLSLPHMKKSDNRCALLHVRGQTQLTPRGSRKNHREVHEVLKLVGELKPIVRGIDGDKTKIAIITPYRAQCAAIRSELRNSGFDDPCIRIGTVHAFQGSEALVVIWSVVDCHTVLNPAGKSISTASGQVGRLLRGETGRRLANVAISRAQQAIYILGDIDHLLLSNPFDRSAQLLNHIKAVGSYVKL